MYMGDRWSNPKQHSAATYVWQPLEIKGKSISLPHYRESWNINTSTGEWRTFCIGGTIIENTEKDINYSGDWEHHVIDEGYTDSRSDEKNANYSFTFTGTQIGIISTARPDEGYAKVEVKDKKGSTVISSTIDMYSKYPETSLKFFSPELKKALILY